MGKGTRIGWTNNSWSWAYGCDETTNPGCKECYAIHRLLPSRSFNLLPGQIRRAAGTTLQQPLKWQARLEQTGEVETVFNSLMDWFHPKLDEWRPEIWDIVRQTPNLIYIILTQRVSNIRRRLPEDWGEGYPNVWLGTSASDQEHADKRIPTLLKIPAALHLVSLEPLVAPVVLRDAWTGQGNRLGWVITGGMSGDNWQQYPLYPKWVRTLRDQCTENSIPFFFKQLGGPAHDYRDGNAAILDGELWQQIPESTANPMKLPQQASLF